MNEIAYEIRHIIMKVYTDLEQSKKLAKILSIESADMHYVLIDSDQETYSPGLGKYYGVLPSILCWSLAALLSVIKPVNENTYTIRGTLDGGAIISFDEITNVMFQEEEIIDAVFEMIVWLKENNKI